MTHLFKKGEKVYVRECTENIPQMMELVGKEVRIMEQTVGHWDKIYPAYKIVEDKGAWFWREDWLDPATHFNEVEDFEFENIIKE